MRLFGAYNVVYSCHCHYVEVMTLIIFTQKLSSSKNQSGAKYLLRVVTQLCQHYRERREMQSRYLGRCLGA
jgi:hypothetical protein